MNTKTTSITIGIQIRSQLRSCVTRAKLHLTYQKEAASTISEEESKIKWKDIAAENMYFPV